MIDKYVANRIVETLVSERYPLLLKNIETDIIDSLKAIIRFRYEVNETAELPKVFFEHILTFILLLFCLNFVVNWKLRSLIPRFDVTVCSNIRGFIDLWNADA